MRRLWIWLREESPGSLVLRGVASSLAQTGLFLFCFIQQGTPGDAAAAAAALTLFSAMAWSWGSMGGPSILVKAANMIAAAAVAAALGFGVSATPVCDGRYFQPVCALRDEAHKAPLLLDLQLPPAPLPLPARRQLQ